MEGARDNSCTVCRLQRPPNNVYAMCEASVGVLSSVVRRDKVDASTVSLGSRLSWGVTFNPGVGGFSPGRARWQGRATI